MPTYTFRCMKCNKTLDLVSSMRESGELKPRCCKAVMVREFLPPRVAPDSYGQPIVKSFLNSMDNDVNKNAPPFESRSQERRYRAEHQRKFGWGGYE